jgi:hypothetical protein
MALRGWYRTFLEDPLGEMEIGRRRVKIRAVCAKGERLRNAVERAYSEKYPSPGSQKIRSRLSHRAAAGNDD